MYIFYIVKNISIVIFSSTNIECYCFTFIYLLIVYSSNNFIVIRLKTVMGIIYGEKKSLCVVNLI